MSQTTFGDLRSAVEDALTTPQHIDQVILLIAQAPDEATVEMWAQYAASKLDHREHDHRAALTQPSSPASASSTRARSARRSSAA